MLAVKAKEFWMVVDNSVFSLKYMWTKSKIYVILQVLSTIIEGLHSPIKVFLAAWLFNILDQGTAFQEALMVVILMLLDALLYNVWGWTLDYGIFPGMWKKLQFGIQSDLLKKVENIELKEYDNPDFYDEFLIVIQEADVHISASIENLQSFISALFTILATAGLFTYVSPVVFVALLISAVVSLVNNVKKKKMNYEANVKSAEYRKKEQYFNRIYRLVDYTKELRSSGINEVLINEYDNNTSKYIRHIKFYGRKKMLFQIVDTVVFYLAFAVVIFCTLYRVTVSKTLLLGGFAIVVNANWQFRNALNKLCDMISEIPKESLYIETIKQFIAKRSDKENKNIALSKFESIELKHVSFGYSTDEKIIDDVSMTIKAGEHIAIVGENGAGKSTLIKLILGLYHPDSGKILINGVDITDVADKDYKKNFGVAFQDYQLFAATLAENVLGDFYSIEDEKFVIKNLEIATFTEKLKSLKNGILSTMTREFDEEGILLSGGEMQKVAIARSFAKESSIIIMDEPTAALDAISESALMSNVDYNTKDKAVITISHRLSTTKNADKIYVLEQGRIKERGNHTELMNLNGKYATFFNMQANKYKNAKGW